MGLNIIQVKILHNIPHTLNDTILHIFINFSLINLFQTLPKSHHGAKEDGTRLSEYIIPANPLPEYLSLRLPHLILILSVLHFEDFGSVPF